MFLQLPQPGPKHPRVNHVAENSAPALLPDGVRSDGVALGALELLRRDRLLSKPGELGKKSGSRDVLLFRRRGDVRHERAGQLVLAAVGVDGVGERLAVAQLIEETPAEPAPDAGDDTRHEAIGVTARRSGKRQRQRGLRLVSGVRAHRYFRRPYRRAQGQWRGRRERSELAGHDCRSGRRIDVADDPRDQSALEHSRAIPVPRLPDRNRAQRPLGPKRRDRVRMPLECSAHRKPNRIAIHVVAHRDHIGQNHRPFGLDRFLPQRGVLNDIAEQLRRRREVLRGNRDGPPETFQ